MADRLRNAGSSSRPVVWDAFLAIGLVAIAAFFGVALSLGALSLPPLGIPLRAFLAAVFALTACALAPEAVRSWPSAQVHSRTYLRLAAFVGLVGAILTTMALEPWPDLLGPEMAEGGQVKFYLEAVKTFVPWLAGSLVAFVALRYDPPHGVASSAGGREAAEQGVEADEAR